MGHVFCSHGHRKSTLSLLSSSASKIDLRKGGRVTAADDARRRRFISPFLQCGILKASQQHLPDFTLGSPQLFRLSPSFCYSGGLKCTLGNKFYVVSPDESSTAWELNTWVGFALSNATRAFCTGNLAAGRLIPLSNSHRHVKITIRRALSLRTRREAAPVALTIQILFRRTTPRILRRGFCRRQAKTALQTQASNCFPRAGIQNFFPRVAPSALLRRGFCRRQANHTPPDSNQRVAHEPHELFGSSTTCHAAALYRVDCIEIDPASGTQLASSSRVKRVAHMRSHSPGQRRREHVETQAARSRYYALNQIHLPRNADNSANTSAEADIFPENLRRLVLPPHHHHHLHLPMLGVGCAADEHFLALPFTLPSFPSHHAPRLLPQPSHRVPASLTPPSFTSLASRSRRRLVHIYIVVNTCPPPPYLDQYPPPSHPPSPRLPDAAVCDADARQLTYKTNLLPTPISSRPRRCSTRPESRYPPMPTYSSRRILLSPPFRPLTPSFSLPTPLLTPPPRARLRRRLPRHPQRRCRRCARRLTQNCAENKFKSTRRAPAALLVIVNADNVVWALRADQLGIVLKTRFKPTKEKITHLLHRPAHRCFVLLVTLNPDIVVSARRAPIDSETRGKLDLNRGAADSCLRRSLGRRERRGIDARVRGGRRRMESVGNSERDETKSVE
ncbi:hypothetical protein R3P38DRAFT_2789143 [Favolaschia claudopus]|uniref:Uncharacterized protein n=1 Tax=Favolaschia claudopus TaxID=2862362 RepID=A0AAW0AJS8_9AGAR